MAPICAAFAVADLRQRIQADVHGRARKPPLDNAAECAPDETKKEAKKDGAKERHRGVNLDACRRLQMTQYECRIERRPTEGGGQHVVCYAVRRWFRECQDRRGAFMVETTAWEGEGSAAVATTTSPTATAAAL